MPFWFLISISFSNLRINKLRSMLTVLGMVFGTGAVIATLSSNEGATRHIKRQLDALNTNVIDIIPKDNSQANLGSQDKEHLLKYANTLKKISLVTPVGGLTSRYQAKTSSITMFGIDPYFFNIMKLELRTGRFFDQWESENARQMVVLGRQVKKELFGDANATGEFVHLLLDEAMFSFEVIGVLNEKGGSQGKILDRGFYVSEVVSKKISSTDGQFVSMLATLADENKSVEAKKQVRGLLAPRFPSGVQVIDAREAIEKTKSIWKKQNLVGICLALISLLTGGVGIMNIMLLSVTQRCKEIGLRKAVGADNTHILVQFLLEAVTICFSGGVLGVIVGMLFGQQVAKMMGQWEAVVSPITVICALGFAVLTGVLFGMMPAYRASRMDPYDALRV